MDKYIAGKNKLQDYNQISQIKEKKDSEVITKASRSGPKKEKYQTYVLCEFIKETIYKQTMASPVGIVRTPDSEVSSCDLLTPGSEGEGPFNLEVKGNGGDSKVVKEKVKLVVGDLENVLGELKTVVGDLRVLVDQIDVVTSKIDEEYGPEFRISELDSDADSRRREFKDSNHNKVSVTNRHSVINPCEVRYAKPDWLYLDTSDRSRSSSKTSDFSERSYKKGIDRSSDTSGCVVSPRDNKNNNTKNENQLKLNNNDNKSDKENGTPNQKRNKRSKNARRIQCKSTHLDIHPVELSDLSPEDYRLKPRSRSMNSMDPHHTHCLPCSPSPDGGDYCGVYERELEMKLELEFDDNLSNYNGIDEQNSFELESFKDFRIRYKDNLNNMWAAYTMGPLDIKDIELEEDPFLDSATDISSSDILNDELAGSGTSNYEGFNPWGTSFDSSDVG